MLIHLFRQFTIRTRMLGAIATVMALMCLVAAAGLFGMIRLDNMASTFIDNTHRGAITLSDLRGALGNVRRYEKDIIINADKHDKVVEYQGKWRTAVGDAQRLSKELSELVDGDDKDELSGIHRLITAYAQAAAPVIAGIANGATTTSSDANAALKEAKAAAHAIEPLIPKLAAHMAEETRLNAQARQTTTLWSYGLLAICFALAVVVVVPLTLINMHSICRPIDTARRLAEQIAEGHLQTDKQLDTRGEDEAARLLRSLTHMQGALSHIVEQVRLSSDSIASASSEIAAGNQDLSNRTEQSASHLEQTAASVEEIAGTVRQSADSAREANELAASAAEVATKGGQVVSQVVSTMEDIHTSSRKISDIIGVIDGIAFQTNILALNAAVEAARAGEQGRGFAVVAGEVRSLAQRSAQAAREIKSLISASVDKVEQGSQLVADAGTTMTEIVNSVQRVSAIISEISHASVEQSSGIGEVNSSVASLDQMTQQNAALVEQAAAAAASLKDQAQHLTQVISVFQTS
ncbi:MAG TPA: methyl-accepting chemotaxis protein [Aquabacterium sp.]|uniref:methyl-accepting chemotaxis protein n=1 Tax=Aquabacterium sp. TaxID=1872578 RepID=UPI002E30C408|nr:methyl-accepting chemotaxis protein [Aquabacterium sp.]HEX5371345.1 methyl-accepting chemotaxis protein [Aquabacterium sp.]